MKDRWKNSLMKRDEVLVCIDHAGKPTPNRKEVMGEVAKLLKTKPENLIVTRISTPGGSTITEVKVYSYLRKEDIPEWKIKKFDGRVAKIKGPAPPPEKAAEAVKTDSAPEGEQKDDAKPEGSEAAPAEEKPEAPAEESKPPAAPSEEKPAGEAEKTEEPKPEDRPTKEDKD